VIMKSGFDGAEKFECCRGDLRPLRVIIVVSRLSCIPREEDDGMEKNRSPSKITEVGR